VVVPLVNGETDWASAPKDDVAAVVGAYPHYLGTLEDLSPAKALATEAGALFVIGADPVAAGVVKTAGQWGADVFVGEGQPFGTALSFGGPYLGLFACTEAQLRRLPGRIVGETVDVEGRRAFVTTLRAREQDIRREKATSNICSNQTLMAVTASIQLGWLGTAGLREVATRCAQGTHYLVENAVAIPGVSQALPTPYFRECALTVPIPARDVVAAMASEGFLAGVALDALLDGADSHAGLDPAHTLLVAVTERRTKDEIDRYVDVLRKVVS